MALNRVESAYDCIDYVASQTDEVILMCSLGKDSLVTLDMAYGKFKRIVCVFMYFVKGLEHIERWVNWVKTRYPNIEFVQIPHWNLTYVLRSGMYCVRQPKIKILNLTMTVDALRKKYGIEYVFLGMKKADSMNRRLMLMQYEANHFTNKGMAYPLGNWTQKEILAYMLQHRLPEPVRYSAKASSGVGFNDDCFAWMEKNCPGDLEKIYKIFPMSRRILEEYHIKEEQKKYKDELKQLEQNNQSK